MLLLNIRQQYAKIDIQTRPAELTLRAVPAKLEMNCEPARVEIRQAKGELEIDQSAYRASVGYKGVLDFAREAAQEGKRTVLETIGRIAAEGDRLGRIETKENAIANMAAEANLAQTAEVTWAPLAAPALNYKLTPAVINITEGQLRITAIPGRVEGNFIPGSVSAPVSQYQSVKMWTTEGKYDISI